MNATLTIKNGTLKIPTRLLKKLRWGNNTRLRMEQKSGEIILKKKDKYDDVIGTIRGSLKGRGISVAEFLQNKKSEKELES